LLAGFPFSRRNEEARRSSNHSRAKVPSRLRAARATKLSSLALLYWFSNSGTRDNAGLQLRRAITIQAEGKKLLEKHAIAPSAARLCYIAASSIIIFFFAFANDLFIETIQI
jgi:hypothetical protein